MSIKIIFINLFVLLAFSSGITFAGDTLKIMTYNLEGMKPGTEPGKRIIHIIEKLREINPDIIGLQEINEFLDGTKNQGRQIADSLSAYFHIPFYFYQSFTHLAWDNHFRESIGIISKYPILNKGFKQLDQGVFFRKVIWCYIKTPLGMVNMFNTHLSFNSSDVRFQQVQQIKNYIKKQEKEHPGIASVLTGDFNDTPEANSITALTNGRSGKFFIDTFAKINPKIPGNTVPASSPVSKIDYIFSKITGLIEIVSSAVVMNKPYDGVNYCSDHLGVLTKFRRTGKLPK